MVHQRDAPPREGGFSRIVLTVNARAFHVLGIQLVVMPDLEGSIVGGACVQHGVEVNSRVERVALSWP